MSVNLLEGDVMLFIEANFDFVYSYSILTLNRSRTSLRRTDRFESRLHLIRGRHVLSTGLLRPLWHRHQRYVPRQVVEAVVDCLRAPIIYPA